MALKNMANFLWWLNPTRFLHYCYPVLWHNISFWSYHIERFLYQYFWWLFSLRQTAKCCKRRRTFSHPLISSLSSREYHTNLHTKKISIDISTSDLIGYRTSFLKMEMKHNCHQCQRCYWYTTVFAATKFNGKPLVSDNVMHVGIANTWWWW